MRCDCQKCSPDGSLIFFRAVAVLITCVLVFMGARNVGGYIQSLESRIAALEAAQERK
jgi:hypothetical protein